MYKAIIIGCICIRLKAVEKQFFEFKNERL